MHLISGSMRNSMISSNTLCIEASLRLRQIECDRFLESQMLPFLAKVHENQFCEPPNINQDFEEFKANYVAKLF